MQRPRRDVPREIRRGLAAWTSTLLLCFACGSRPEHEPLRIAFVGDSITERCEKAGTSPPCAGFVERLDAVLPERIEVVNAGVGGATTWAWTEPGLFEAYGVGYEAWLVPHLPVDRAVVLLGANDARTHYVFASREPIEPPEFEQRLRTLADRLAAEGVTRIMLLEPLPQPRAAPAVGARLVAYREIVADLCGSGPPLECGPPLHDMPEHLFFRDGLHPSPQGHAWIARRLLPALDTR